MPPTTNSMLCLRYKLPERKELSNQIESHLHTTLKFGGGGLVSEFLCLIVAKTMLSTMEVLVSKVLIDSNISHDEFVLKNNVLK